MQMNVTGTDELLRQLRAPNHSPVEQFFFSVLFLMIFRRTSDSVAAVVAPWLQRNEPQTVRAGSGTENNVFALRPAAETRAPNGPDIHETNSHL